MVIPPADSADELSDENDDREECKLLDFDSDSSSEPPNISELDDLLHEIEQEEMEEYLKHTSQPAIQPAENWEADLEVTAESNVDFAELVPIVLDEFPSESPYTQPDPQQSLVASVTSAMSVSDAPPIHDCVVPVAGTSSDLSTQNFVVPVTSPILSPLPRTTQNVVTNPTRLPKRRVYQRKGLIPAPPALRPVPPKKKPPPPNVNWKWKKNTFKYPVDLPNDDFSTCDTCRSPAEYFEDFFSADIFTLMVEQTNLYSVQQTTTSVNTTVEEMKTFIAIELIMGVTQMPAYTDFWSTELKFPIISEKMPLKRYQKLRRYIHFADNTTDNGTDPYFKVRPIAEGLRRNFLKIPNEKRMSIDEMMVPYKGKKAGFRRQYLPKKPKKWGFKVFVRAGVSGIVYDYILYGGQWTFQNTGSPIYFPANESHFGFGAQIVLALSQTIQNKPTTVLFFDNFFTSPLLIKHLREEYGILSLGTLRENRCKTNMMTDKLLMKKRGNIDYRSDNRNRLAVVKWADTKVVTLASSYVGHSPIEKKERFDKKKNKKVKVKCPQIVKHYNDHMGGVDLADMLVALYRTQFRTHRYYLAIFSQLLDVAVNNAWLIYRRDFLSARTNPKEKPMILKKFRLHIAESLSHKNRKGRPSATSAITRQKKLIRKPRARRPIDEVRLDRYDHFPQYNEKKSRCKYCVKGITRVLCVKCNLYFCFTSKSNCFLEAHTKK